ncbi:DNA-binding protein HU [Plesiocystis pacifica SIR-1]|uniref:DNA-binding protein HU n=1 Tax=Plesiocystis pacifica SIR-1 TaxID=391625 RepID=A6G9U9_9BACT|nr:HU family DNA-binding protein [Plesiocystis pacifica]EDM77385.1 DNA-binding protein HU [Plesiocystis pacifica SIR-1]
MTKAELIDRIARNRDLPPEVTKKVIAQILDLAFSELSTYFVRTRLTRSSTPRFTFPKFGTWTKKTRSGRRGVNPRTLEPMDIEACDTIDFKPSAELKRLLNEVNKGGAKAGKGGAKNKSAAKKKSTKKKAAKKKAVKKSSKKKPVDKSSVKAGVKAGRKRADASEGGAAKSSARDGSKASKKTKSKSKSSKSRGPGGRRLVSREDVELERLGEPLLPEAPLQGVRQGRAKSRRKSFDETGS